MLTNDQLAAWDRENFFHHSTHLANHAHGETPSRVITGGKGVYIEDRDGKRLLDAFAGLYCVNVSYGCQEIADAIAEQAKELAYYHACQDDPGSRAGSYVQGIFRTGRVRRE